MIYLIHPDGRREDIHMDGEPTLGQLQEWVGGYIQHLPAVYEGERADFIMNEEGKLLELAPNPTATEILHAIGGHPLDYIAGTAVILTGHNRLR